MRKKLPDKFMTINEVAELLSVSRRSIDRLIAAEEIPYYAILTRKRFDPAEIAEWIERNKRGA